VLWIITALVGSPSAQPGMGILRLPIPQQGWHILIGRVAFAVTQLLQRGIDTGTANALVVKVNHAADQDRRQARPDRVAKYNLLLLIESELGDIAYAGAGPLQRFQD